MKTVCIYHSVDLDGWMSTAIVKYWWQNSPNAIDNNDDKLDLIGYNHGDPIPDLSEYDKVIMCDISFSLDKNKYPHLPINQPMLDLFDRLSSNFIWIDHHISAIKDNVIFDSEKGGYMPINYNGLRNIDYAACELTWKYFFPNETMPEIVRLLGRYDCFGHKGTDEEQKVLEFQYGARSCISNYEQCYNWLLESISYQTKGQWNSPHQYSPEAGIHELGKAIYVYLCTEAKQAYKNGFEIILSEFIEEGKAWYYKFICINKERFNPINFGIDYHKDGYVGAACFHYANGMWNFSLYNDNGLVDCSLIAKQYGGGGHKGAAGFRLNIIEFIKLLNNN